MSDAIIVALITGACAVIAQAIIARQNTKELYTKLDKQSELADQKLDAKIQVMDTKIEELTREVRAHNNFAQRIPVLENRVETLERKVS